MERRVGGWRSIPPELGVPAALGGGLDSLSFVLMWLTGTTVNVGAGPVRSILLVAGLLELRRRAVSRSPGMARMLVVATVLQSLAIAAYIVGFISPYTGRELWGPVLDASSYASTVLTVGYAAAMLGAAGAWRSSLAPVALVTALAWHLPPVAFRWLALEVTGTGGVRLFTAAAAALQVVPMLAILRRLGERLDGGPDGAPAEAAPRGDLARAERGARRVARALRWQVLLIALLLAGSMLLVRSEHNVFAGLSVTVAGLALVGALATEISGMICIARAELPDLAPVAMCTGAFIALWQLLTLASHTYYQRAMPQSSRVDVSTLVAIVIGAAGALIAASAVRELAMRRRDRSLRDAVSIRIGWIVALVLVQLAGLVLVRPGAVAAEMLFGLFSVAVSLGTAAALAGIYGRLAERLRLAAAVDAF